ncbi:hypothetical protein N9I58_02190 [Candidatus Thioglobus sp.]|nr:hypothetical protein [Candidatus Thioglobus sp.]
MLTVHFNKVVIIDEKIKQPYKSQNKVCNFEAIKLAEEPEFKVIKCLIPINYANSASNFLLNCLSVSQPSKDATTIYYSSIGPTSFPEVGVAVLPGLKNSSANYITVNWTKRVSISNCNSLVALIIHILHIFFNF